MADKIQKKTNEACSIIKHEIFTYMKAEQIDQKREREK
jgi:hypothetical protein